MRESGAYDLARVLGLPEEAVVQAIGDDWDGGVPGRYRGAPTTNYIGKHGDAGPRVVIRVDLEFKLVDIGPARGVRLEDGSAYWGPGEPTHGFAFVTFDDLEEVLGVSPEEQQELKARRSSATEEPPHRAQPAAQ